MLSFQKSVPNNTNKLSISSEEDTQLFIFEILINDKTKIRQIVKNRSGYIIYKKNLEYCKINKLEILLLDLRLLKEYKLTGKINLNISETILSSDRYMMRFTDVDGILKIFYHINN